MIKKGLILLSLILIVLGQEGCQHDKYVVRTTRTCTNNCPTATIRTAANKPLPFRLTWDTSSIFDTKIALPTVVKTLITNSTQIITRYLKDVIQVIQETANKGNNVYKGAAQCLKFTPVPATVSTTGIALSDLHIYIVADTTSPSISEEPFGVACSWLPTGMFHPDRPNFGIIKFPLTEINNLKQVSESKQVYQKRILNTLLHQVFHILGLSVSESSYWHKWTLNGQIQYYGANTQTIVEENNGETVGNHQILITPNVQQQVFNQYSYEFYDYPDNYPGMKLENQGVSNTGYPAPNLQSHWEMTVALGEIMNVWGYASSQLNPVVSKITLALLLDTGFYANVNVNLGEQLFFGLHQGYEFLADECSNPKIQFKEYFWNLDFKNGNDEEEYQICDFYDLGPATKYISWHDLSVGDQNNPNTDTPPNLKFIDQGCQLLITKDSDSCINDSKPKPLRFLSFEQSGSNSRCFQSDIVAVNHNYEPLNNFLPNQISNKKTKCYNTFATHFDQKNLYSFDYQYELSFNIGRKVFDLFAQFDYYWFYLSLSNHMNATNSTWDDPYNYPIVDYFGEFFSADSFSLSADAYELNLENLYGGLIAPFDDPVSFIQLSYLSDCPNLCSLNGYCVKGGDGCVCLDNFVGLDCSIPQVAKQTTCNSKKLMLDQITGDCVEGPTCPRGRYASTAQTCLRCPYGCQTCTNAQTCTLCSDYMLLQNGLCVDTCSFNYYTTDLTPGQCVTCPQLIFSTPPLNCQYCYKIQDLGCLSCFLDDPSTCV